MNASQFGVKGQGHDGIKYAETALSGLVAQSLEKYQSDFHQTYTNDVLWDRDECIKFQGQKVKALGHSGITYAGTIAVQAEAYSTRRLVSSQIFQ